MLQCYVRKAQVQEPSSWPASAGSPIPAGNIPVGEAIPRERQVLRQHISRPDSILIWNMVVAHIGVLHVATV
ncbi:hypothetical protein BRADI_4g41702v3 [Brachypodium distachyon]|uniref:Uncharacterized protein n=1 Tax=Brachypodium distachyon TaxID=15368 RepID=A0A0Q3LHL1_BRADI|nr:hypothetical protein BRADI_4g41702v3 [Brachypodium distachyon]